MEACYGGTDVMERSCAVARGKDINFPPPCLPFFGAPHRALGRLCLPGRVLRGGGPPLPSHPPSPLGQNKGRKGRGGRRGGPTPHGKAPLRHARATRGVVIIFLR
jgi:hypothetical protein